MEEEEFVEVGWSAKEQKGGASPPPRLGCTPTAPKDGEQSPVTVVACHRRQGRGVRPGPMQFQRMPAMLQTKGAICVCVIVCVRAYLCACVCGAREFVCVAAAECLWDPPVEGGIIIVTTTTTTPEDYLDCTATTAATPHAALAGNR